jgi:hypothetical protein
MFLAISRGKRSRNRLLLPAMRCGEHCEVTVTRTRIVVGRGHPQSGFDHAAVFAAYWDNDVAVEINCRPERKTRRAIC